MEYSQKTQDLIERQCRNVERKEFILDKKLSEELIMKTYDIFNLDRPKKVMWFDDLTSKKWNEIVNSTWSARSANSAWSLSSASSTWSASSASSAWSANSAWSAWSARSALDYDFDWYIFAFQYKEDQTENPINESDIKYLEYCELLMQAKEAGLGYRVELDDTLYLVPNPIVRLNNDTPPQYHSDQLPAISWKNGEELYYLDGVNFPKELWEKVVAKQMTLSEIMKIEISDQRTVALKYNPEAIIKENAKLVHKDDRNNELYLVENSEINKFTNFPKMYFLKMICPTGRVFIEGVEPKFAEKHPNATECQAELCGLLKSEYMDMVLES